LLRKRNFKKEEYDKTIRKKLNASFNDMVANFSKFNSLILTKEHLGNLIDEKEISKGGGFCNVDTITSKVEEVRKLEGSASCPSPKGFMDDRIKEIFGTNNMKELPTKLKKNLDEVDKNSCMSQSLYLNLRASNGASSIGFREIVDNKLPQNKFKSFINEASTSQNNALKDLLTFDVFFNLAYRDDVFYQRLQENIEFKEKNGDRRYDIYNDKETLTEAYSAINRSCNKLVKNVASFLCSGE
jgi:hypothetical protein